MSNFDRFILSILFVNVLSAGKHYGFGKSYLISVFIWVLWVAGNKAVKSTKATHPEERTKGRL